MDLPEEIRIDQIPSKVSWRFTPLYNFLPDGTIKMWQIGFDGVNLQIFNDDILVSTEKISSNNVLQYIRGQYIRQLKDGYVSSINTPIQIKPMKANKYTGTNVKTWPVYIQPKLNGIRMLSNRVGNNIIMKSSLGTVYGHLQHIGKELIEFLYYLPHGTILDGELYNHSMSFPDLTSTVKTTKTLHPKLSSVQYWIFDICYEDHEGTPYEKRYTLLVHAFHRYLEDKGGKLPNIFGVVPTNIARNHEEIIQYHNKYVSCGYEGLMIKKISLGTIIKDSIYKSGRCSNILKYKEFTDEEFLIVGHENNVYTVKNNNFLKPFHVSMRGNMEHNIIGKYITVKYIGVDSFGMPINPIGIAIRDYE